MLPVESTASPLISCSREVKTLTCEVDLLKRTTAYPRSWALHENKMFPSLSRATALGTRRVWLAPGHRPVHLLIRYRLSLSPCRRFQYSAACGCHESATMMTPVVLSTTSPYGVVKPGIFFAAITEAFFTTSNKGGHLVVDQFSNLVVVGVGND